MVRLALPCALLALAGCAFSAPAPPPTSEPTVGFVIVQQYESESLARVMPWKAPSATVEGAQLTLSWPNGTTTTTNLTVARGPDEFFEGVVPRAGFSSCAFGAILTNESGPQSVGSWHCGTNRAWFLRLGGLSLSEGRVRVDATAWRAVPGRIADWSVIGREASTMAPETNLTFTSWSLDIGGGRVVTGAQPSGKPAAATYRFEGPGEGDAAIGIGSFRFRATLPGGRVLTQDDADVRLG